jgi:hypothetical protein
MLVDPVGRQQVDNAKERSEAMTEDEVLQALLRKLLLQARGALDPSGDETLNLKDIIVRQIRAQAPSSELVGGSADDERRRPKPPRIDDDPTDAAVMSDRNRDDAIVVIDPPTTSPS